MARSRKFAVSRLMTAWVALLVTVGAGALAVIMMPSPADEPDLVIDLPEEPDRFARANNDAGVSGPDLDDVAETEPGEADRGGDPARAGGETSTTDSADESAILTPVVEAMAGTREETLPDGALRIIIPQTDGQAAASRRAAPPKGALSGLTVEGEHGITPIRGADGRTPFAAYRRQPGLKAGRRNVAILVSGLGIDRELTELAIETLPPEVSFSFAPYSRGVADLMAMAVADGHEVSIELPMEGRGISVDALGPAALLTGRSVEANQTRLDWLLARAPAYAMATNYFGQTFAADPDAMTLLMSALQAHGLAYVDDTGLGAKAAAEFGVPYARVDVLVSPSAGSTAQGLERLGALADERPGLAKVYASADAINAVTTWIGQLDGAGLDLVPVSAIAVSKP